VQPVEAGAAALRPAASAPRPAGPGAAAPRPRGPGAAAPRPRGPGAAAPRPARAAAPRPAARRPNRRPSILGEAELVDVVARVPVPKNLAVPGDLVDAIVLEEPVRDVRLHATRVREDQGLDALGRGRELGRRSEEHTSELQSRENLVCRLLLEKKNKIKRSATLE